MADKTKGKTAIGKKESTSGKVQSSSKINVGSTDGPSEKVQDVGFGQGFMSSDRLKVKHLQQAKIQNDLLLPNLPMRYPKSTLDKASSWKRNTKARKSLEEVGIKEFKRRTSLKKTDKEYLPKAWMAQKNSSEFLKAQKKLRQEYFENNLIPFFNTVKERKSSNALFPLTVLRSKIPKVDIAVEKPSLLSKEEKSLEIGSFGGQNIQAKTDDQEYKGLYFQDAEKNEINHFFKADVIKVDADDTGHYLAFMNELYSGQKAKAIYFGGKKGEVDLKRVNRFLAKQVVSSLSYQRNKAIKDALKHSLSEVKLKEDLDIEGVFSPLAYRNSAGKVQDLSVSEEQIAICFEIYDDPITVNAYLVDKKSPIIFNYQGEDLDQSAIPTLAFSVTGGEVKPLDSDTLLVYAVSELNLEPDAVQNMLESLYQQGWINYPRTDTVKALDEPLYLLRDFELFKGTEYERKLLQIIDESHNAYKNEKPYLQEGAWILRMGDKPEQELTKKGYKLVSEPSFYDHEAFDITLDKGLTPQELTEYLTENSIGTPATRTTILSALKEAGIISLDKNRNYQLDRRGLYFASCYQFFIDNEIELGIDLKNKLEQISDINEMLKLINLFDVLDRKQLKRYIKITGDELIDRQYDLTKLESY